MKMDWGYESETGQVWLFNVTPFTPHLPHWQPVFLCVCVHAAVGSCASFLCLPLVCMCTHMYILWQIYLFILLVTLKAQCVQHISWSSDM